MGACNSAPPLRVPPRGGGSFNITSACISLTQAITLQCIALTKWSNSLPKQSWKRYQHFFKKGFFKGGTMLQRGAQKNCAPPTQMLSYAPGWRFKYMNGLKLCRQPLLKGLSRDPFIRTFCKHMTSPTVAVLSTVKHAIPVYSWISKLGPGFNCHAWSYGLTWVC